MPRLQSPEARKKIGWETSVLQQREANIHINASVRRAAFIEIREARDGQVSVPRLLISALQVNLHASRLPEAGENGIQYLGIPIDAL